MNEKSTLEHTVVICIFGTIVALIWFSFAYSNNSIAAKFVENVRDWQTLIASIIATAAAGATVWAIFKQIGEAKKIDERKQAQLEDFNKRKFTANKILFPHALASINRYADECISYVNPIVELFEGRQERHATITIPQNTFQSEAPNLEAVDLQTLSFIAQLAPVDSNLPKYISDFSCSLQIQNARLHTLRNDLIRNNRRISEYQVVTLLSNIYDVKNVGENLYEFARNKSSDVEVTEEFLQRCHMPGNIRISEIPRISALMLDNEQSIFSGFWRNQSQEL